MGQKRDTYSEWTNRYDDLLEIYREARPRLDQKQDLDDILEYAKARWYSLDPKHLHPVGEIGADPDPHRVSNQGVAEAQSVSWELTELISKKSFASCLCLPAYVPFTLCFPLPDSG